MEDLGHPFSSILPCLSHSVSLSVGGEYCDCAPGHFYDAGNSVTDSCAACRDVRALLRGAPALPARTRLIITRSSSVTDCEPGTPNILI